jgi:hypothetical protein
VTNPHVINRGKSRSWKILAGRTNASCGCPPLCPTSSLCRRGQAGHRRVECVDEPGSLIGQPHVAPQLPAERLDQPRPRWRRCACRSNVQLMSTRPCGIDRAPNFVALVQSSLSVIAIAITAADAIRIWGPEIENFGSAELSKASVALRTIVSRFALLSLPSKSKSCARPSASRRPSMACCASAAPGSPRRLCETMAPTVARVFLIRWCSSSSISFCSLSDASRSLASRPARESAPSASISACASRSRRLRFSAARLRTGIDLRHCQSRYHEIAPMFGGRPGVINALARCTRGCRLFTSVLARREMKATR